MKSNSRDPPRSPSHSESEDDDGPEMVSVSTSKANIVSQMRRERQAGKEVNDRRKRLQAGRQAENESKKAAQIQAAMADFMVKRETEDTGIVREEPVESKLIKFGDSEEESQFDGEELPNGSKLVLLSKPSNCLSRHLQEARKALSRTKSRLVKNENLKRVPSASVTKKSGLVKMASGQKKKKQQEVVHVVRLCKTRKPFRMTEVLF